jgi:hypothetical protein
VEIRIDDGQWQAVSDNDTVKIKRGSSVYARLSYTNLGEAAWLSSKDSNQSGTVCIRVEGSEKRFVPVPSPLKHLENGQSGEILIAEPGKAPVPVTIGFEARKRANFGPKFTLKFETVE